MKLSSKTTVIYGPPGTGKTTVLTDIVDDLIMKGVDPARIAYLGFTKRAAKEARDRVQVKSELEPEELINFCTIHSFCRRVTGMRGALVGIEEQNIILEGLRLRLETGAEGMLPHAKLAKEVIIANNVLRAGATVHRANAKVQRYTEALDEYKRIFGAHDFTDMLEQFIMKQPDVSGIDYLFVDEAQDLSKLQWQIIDIISRQVKEVFVAGDDDQAIYRWNGAHVESFIDLEGIDWVLDSSWRVPRSIQTAADKVLYSVQNRVDKVWHAADREGTIKRISNLSSAPIDSGEWLILTRNTHYIHRLHEHCAKAGIPVNAARNTDNDNELEAIATWRKLQLGKKVLAKSAAGAVAFMSRETIDYARRSKLYALPGTSLLSMEDLRADFGLKRVGSWPVIFDKFSRKVKGQLLRAWKTEPESIFNPRIKIRTIHSIKGGEADNVIVVPDMQKATYEGYIKEPDDEARVWYVALTRAKKSLYLMVPRQSKAYPLVP